MGRLTILSDLKNILLEFLRGDFSKLKVVTLPDFFLDRIVSLDCGLSDFSSEIGSVIKRKGGSLDQIPQMDLRGGNAVNVASALGHLGANAIPIICTNNLGLEQLRLFLKPIEIDTSYVKVKPKSSITTALEFRSENEETNVMLRDLGSLENFGPDDIDEKDFSLIEESNYVCVFNWAGTRKYGTALTEAVFRRAKKKGKCKTYLNTADPTPLKEKISGLAEKVLLSGLTDILSVNENEAITYAKYLEKDFSIGKQQDESASVLEAAQILASRLSTRVDLHTAAFSATVTEDDEVIAPSFNVKLLRATGAGDSWDAGNLIGDAGGLSDEGRLTLANAVSGYYISNERGKHPSPQELSEFIESRWKDRRRL